MTAKLKVTIDVPTTRSRPMLIPATARNLASGMSTEFVVPLGGVPAELSLDEGPYLIEVYLPSGELMRRATLVLPDGEATVTLTPSGTRPDWLQLQQLTLPNQRLERGEPRAVRGPPARVWRSSSPAPIAPDVAPARVPAAYTAFQLRAGVDGAPPLPRLMADLVASPLSFLTGGPRAPLASTNRDETVVSYRFPPDGAQGRVIAIVQGGGVVDVVGLPGEWRTLHQDLAEIEVVFNHTTGALSATVEDPDLAMVLGYLAGGQASLAARALAGVAKDLLAEKIENRYAAAVGGYVLLRQALAGEEQDRSWRRWIRHLVNLSPDLPDANVILGALLRYNLGPEGDPDATAEEAAECFLRAAAAGVPTFAAGVRLLLEGLLSFGPSEATGLREKIDEATLWIRRVASALDTRQPFTTLEIALGAESQ